MIVTLELLFLLLSFLAATLLLGSRSEALLFFGFLARLLGSKALLFYGFLAAALGGKALLFLARLFGSKALLF
jgi:hypothetical protein